MKFSLKLGNNRKRKNSSCYRKRGDGMEKRILNGLLIMGLFLVPFTIKGKFKKDWIIIFLLKGFFSSIMDTFLTRRNKVSYPKRFLPKYFQINVLFDYLLFPITCVLFNQSTYHSNVLGIMFKALLFSVPMTVGEMIFEKNTKLIKFSKQWSWIHTLVSEMLTFMGTRLFIGLVRKYSK